MINLIFLPIIAIVGLDLVQVGLGAPTFALDADGCEPASATVRSRGLALHVTVRGRSFGSCRFGYETLEGTWQCSVTGGFIVFTSEGPHAIKCSPTLIIDRSESVPDLVWEGEIVNGVRKGLWIGWSYTVSGREKWESVWYRDGRRNGEFISYRQEGFHGYYRDDRKSGHWTIGADEGEYIEGLRNGLWVKHRGNGLQSASMYRRDFRYGLQVTYHPNGRPETIGCYGEPYKTGAWRTFSPTGRMIKEEHFRGGQLHGRSRIWDEHTGALVSDVQWANGKAVLHRNHAATQIGRPR